MKLFGLISKGNFKKSVGISAVLLLTSIIDAAIIDTWIICGQSNAEGYGITESPVSGLAPADTLLGIGRPDLNVTHNNVRFYQMGTELWASSSAGLSSFPNETWHSMLPHEGLCYDWGSGRGNESGRRFGPELSFGYKMQNYLGAEIAIIKQARGSATLASGTTQNSGDGYWNDYDPTDTRNNQYDKLIATITNAVNALPPGDTLRIQGVLWMQGEGDAGNNTMANAYGANLTEFISELRSSLSSIAASSGTKLLPATSWNETRFFVGKIAGGGSTPRVNTIRSAMDAVAAADANVWTVEAKDGMTFMTTDDWGNGGLHYDTAGQILLGERFYATALGAMIGEFVDPETPSSALPVSGGTNWQLTFSDEFNGTSLDTRKWGIDVSTKSRNPRPSQGIDDWWWKSENVTIDGSGYVALHVTKHDSNTMHCGSISSDGLYETQYGYLEARIKIADTTKSTHTAFWLQGENMINGTPPNGSAHDGAEVDIFESAWFGDYTKAVVHIDGYGAGRSANTKQYSTPGLHSGYHVFGLEWDASSMKIYYDGVHKVTYTGDWVPQVPEWLWFSVGASFGDIGTFTSEPVGWLTSAEVDYVRVWKATPETTPPSIVSTTPANGSTSVNPVDDLVITFDEDIAFGSGNITLRQSGGALVESFDVGAPSPRLTLSGGTVTINPTANLALLTTYYIEIDATAIDDLAGNSFAGFTGNGTWSFTTVAPDTTDPGISALSPAHTASGVNPASNLIITFTENVVFDTGAITLRQSGGALIETFNVASPPAGLTLSGDTVTINPTANLGLSTSYYIEIDATAIDDLAGNSFAGIIGSSTWNFTTAAILRVATVDSSAFNSATSNAIDTSDPNLIDWGYVDKASSRYYGTGANNPNGTIDSLFREDPDNVLFNDIGNAQIPGSPLPAGTNLTTVGGTAPIGSVTLTENGTLDSAFAEPAAYTFGGNNAFGGYRALNAADEWTMNFNDLGVGTFQITLYMAINGTNHKVLDMDYTLVDGSTITGTTSSLSTSNYNSSLVSGLTHFTYVIVVTTASADADLSLVFGYVSGATAGQPHLSGYTITDITPPGNTFADWISGFPGLGGLTAFDDDADGDGIENGIENYFGTHPGEFSQGLVSGISTGNTFTFTHPLNGSPASDLTAGYRWSKDLAAFHADGGSHEGTTVSFSQGTPSGGMVTVTASITGTPIDRLFVDLEVTQD